VPLSNEQKVLLIEEVVSTAMASWQIYVEADKKFLDWPHEKQSQPEYCGYFTLKSLLSHSLMASCYALIDTGKRSYSMHHAVKDRELVISPAAKQEYENCCNLRGKIAIYRNNVTAHVNSSRSQSDWAQFADIKNRDISEFLRNAHQFVKELGRANLHEDFVPSSEMQFKRDFRAFCRVISDQEI
jgi:hypothetical protein